MPEYPSYVFLYSNNLPSREWILFLRRRRRGCSAAPPPSAQKYAPNTATPTSLPGDYTQLSSVTYDLPRDATYEQTDCPRFSTRTDVARDWNDGNGVDTIFHGDYSHGTVTTPDGVVYKEILGTSGWQKGLTLQTETWWNGARKKWTEVIWENGNASASYQINPRVVETNIYDDRGNRKKTTMAYTDYNSVSDIKEYSNATDVYRHTHIDYERGTAYIDNKNRRMTGLVKSQTVLDGSGALFSKGTYEYDLGGDYLVHQGPPIRHDSTKYGASFIQGRGNVNVIRQWDVTDSNNIAKTRISKAGYNTSGSLVYTEDGLGHRSNFKYDDSFSDSLNTRNTYAYPTEAKDPDGYASIVKYNFDFGAITRTQNPKGAAVVNTFDVLGRLEGITNEVNQAYTRYVYASNQLSVQTYTTITDLSSEFYSIKIVDGHGRLRAAASEHPNSTGGRRGQYFEYNNLGQQVRQTNPTEIDVWWNPVGDDSVGFAWSSQQYDWKGRPTVSVSQDGISKAVSYESCGCTGVNMITYTDEVGRTGKSIYDIFGRLTQTQALNTNGSVYSTTTTTYNVLDQALQIFEQDAASGIGQQTLMTYDGYGRLASSKTPIQSSPTIYSYNIDDTLNTVTDARGATKNYAYNNRQMVTSITYGAPSGVWATPNVNFSYDEVGNRTLMVDGSGQVSYQYDALSRMTSETRMINGLSSSYTFGYEYNLSGQLTKLHEPQTQIGITPGEIIYGYDKAGALSAINVNGYDLPSRYNGNNQLVGNIKYRAWGGAKERLYSGNNKEISTYNARMQISHYQVDDVTNGINTRIDGDINYYADSRVKFVSDLINKAVYLDNNSQEYSVPRVFDRYYEYDQVGRLSKTYTGADARQMVDQGSVGVMTLDGPYNQTFKYEVFGNLTDRRGYFWSKVAKESTPTYINNRDLAKTYDSAGNVLMNAVNPENPDHVTSFYYDAEGRQGDRVKCCGNYPPPC